MPKTTATQAAKQYRALGRAYEALVEVFENSMKEEETNQNLIAEANSGTQVWAAVSSPYSSGVLASNINIQQGP